MRNQGRNQYHTVLYSETVARVVVRIYLSNTFCEPVANPSEIIENVWPAFTMSRATIRLSSCPRFSIFLHFKKHVRERQERWTENREIDVLPSCSKWTQIYSDIWLPLQSDLNRLKITKFAFQKVLQCSYLLLVGGWHSLLSSLSPFMTSCTFGINMFH